MNFFARQDSLNEKTCYQLLLNLEYIIHFKMLQILVNLNLLIMMNSILLIHKFLNQIFYFQLNKDFKYILK